MKGVYDSVPWESEMAGLQDGASRFQVWRKLILPQIRPGIAALSIFSFIAGWSEYVLPLILAPSAGVQTLSVYLAGLLQDNYLSDFGLFKAGGIFYIFCGSRVDSRRITISPNVVGQNGLKDGARVKIVNQEETPEADGREAAEEDMSGLLGPGQPRSDRQRSVPADLWPADCKSRNKRELEFDKASGLGL